MPFLLGIYHDKVSQIQTSNTFLYDTILYTLYKILFYVTNQFHSLDYARFIFGNMS